jgi:hypothetical protein
MVPPTYVSTKPRWESTPPAESVPPKERDGETLEEVIEQLVEEVEGAPRIAKEDGIYAQPTTEKSRDPDEGRLPIPPVQVAPPTHVVSPVTSTAPVPVDPPKPGFSAFDAVEERAHRRERAIAHHIWWPGSAGDFSDDG